MKATELRIGNWYLYGKHEIQFDLSDFYQLYKNESFIQKINPMQLTDTWLFKLGFETDNITWRKGNFAIGDYNNGYFFLPTGSLSNKGTEIKSVHQLQDLYFSLTEKELKPLILPL